MAIKTRLGEDNPFPHSGEMGESEAEMPQRWSADEPTRIGAPPEGKQDDGFISEPISADWMNWGWGWMTWSARSVIPFVDQYATDANGMTSGTPVFEFDLSDTDELTTLLGATYLDNRSVLKIRANSNINADSKLRSLTFDAQALATNIILNNNVAPSAAPLEFRERGDLDGSGDREYPLTDIRAATVYAHNVPVVVGVMDSDDDSFEGHDPAGVIDSISTTGTVMTITMTRSSKWVATAQRYSDAGVLAVASWTGGSDLTDIIASWSSGNAVFAITIYELP